MKHMTAQTEKLWKIKQSKSSKKKLKQKDKGMVNKRNKEKDD